MPHETVFVTLHIHTDGPIPGPHSLLTLSSAAHRGDGGLISTFTTNLRELPGATLHPASLRAVADAGGRLDQHPPGRTPAGSRDQQLRPVGREAPWTSDARHGSGGTRPPVRLLVPPPLLRALALRPDQHGVGLVAASLLRAERMPTGTGPHQLTTPRRPVLIAPAAAACRVRSRRYGDIWSRACPRSFSGGGCRPAGDRRLGVHTAGDRRFGSSPLVDHHQPLGGDPWARQRVRQRPRMHVLVLVAR
jgi:hypothetical protein